MYMQIGFPYVSLCFLYLSRNSEADDCVEEHKLLGQDSSSVKLLSIRGLYSGEGSGESRSNSEEIIANLQECIKTERDQKVSMLLNDHLIKVVRTYTYMWT